MKVQIKLTENMQKPIAVIYTSEITDDIRQAASLLQGGKK